MTPRVRAVCHAAIGYFDGDVKRVQHFLKVLQFSTLIAEEEALPPEQLEILQMAACLHDIGIPNSEKSMAAPTDVINRSRAFPLRGSCSAGSEQTNRRQSASAA